MSSFLEKKWRIVSFLILFVFMIGGAVTIAVYMRHKVKIFANIAGSIVKVKLSDKVYLSSVGGDLISFTDNDGFGLFYGKVILVGFDDDQNKKLLFAYDEDFLSNSKRTIEEDVPKWAIIDIETGRVVKINSVDEYDVSRLKKARDFLEEHQ